MKNFIRIVSIGAAAMVAACGDSSGGGGAPYIDIRYGGPVAAISIDDPATIGTVVTSANAGLANFGGAGDTTAVTGTVAAPSVNVQAVLAALRRFRGDGVALPTGVSQFDTQPCAVSGSVTVQATFADPNLMMLQQGDTFSVTFNACDDGGQILSGSETLTVTACPGGQPFLFDPTTMTPDALYEMTMVVTDFVVVDPFGYYSGIEGDMAVGMRYVTDLDGQGGWLTSSISGVSLAFAEGYDRVAATSASLTGIGGTGRYEMESGTHFPYGLSDFWPDFFSTGFSARICSTEMGGCLDVVNDPPFVLGEYDTYPSSGTLRVSDDAGHFVQVTATSPPGNVTVTYDIGAGVQGPFSTTWACLDAVDSSSCF